MDLTFLALSYFESYERPNLGQQLVKWQATNEPIEFGIPDQIEFCMNLGNTIVTNIISNTSMSNTCLQELWWHLTRSIKRGICRAKTTGAKWDHEMRAVTSHKILDADWLK